MDDHQIAPSIKTEYLEIWIQEDILHCVYADKLEIDLDIAKKCVAARLDFCKGRAYPCLVDAKGIRSISKEARTYFADEGTYLVKAGALITSTPLTNMLGNIFIFLNKPAAPTRLFTDESEAKEWLRQYV